MLVDYRPPFLRVARQIGKPLAFFGAWALFISVLRHRGIEFRLLALPDLPLSMFGAALGIFLGFRTNSAYDRWWEARTLWGALINQSRTWARQVMAYVPDRGIARSLVMAQIGYVHALRLHLRAHDPFEEIAPFLPPEDVDWLRSQQNAPAGILHISGQQITALANDGAFTEFRLQRLDITLTELTNVQGGCERIRNTPLPRQYDYYPELYIYVYCILLPLAIVEELRLMTPFIVMLVATVFLILNRIGRNLEDPFEESIYALPLLSMSRTIEINLRQLINEGDVPPAVRPIRGVLL